MTLGLFMSAHVRSPHIVLVVLTFIVLGPVILGIVWAFQPIGNFDPEMAFVILMGWWSIGVWAGPGGWLLTNIPTILAAALYWVVCNAFLRLLPTSAHSRLAIIGVSAAAGAFTSVASWVVLLPFLGGRSMYISAVSSALQCFGVVATGVILGVVLGFFCREKSPNSTVEPDARNNGARRSL